MANSKMILQFTTPAVIVSVNKFVQQTLTRSVLPGAAASSEIYLVLKFGQTEFILFKRAFRISG